ncbi:TIGR04283 family arsenosugar biosynthesis glycosyltransferase [Geitlerinema sp. PCC 7407]|uniref:TIGR04283 family arsenosugar biosynthesis glycosyltransferase n=1 Tax=Geitlerinema sp. PCC 7407 TaxID=1173025 RepID=UPI00029FDD78|nr:TIGR04283 family arsenosugar biosynthesis glycosyltransferase [Geitlerinema sp. PCC 7407]AFY67954.1 glycosyl transferase family 2 [Geitlerinema sp. PCC 7407]
MVDVSVIIPVLKEGPAIQAALERLAAQQGGLTFEVIVVDGDRDGSTLQHIADCGVPVRGITAPKGRGSQMNAGAQAAQGEVLLFLHADAELPPQGLAQALAVIRQGRGVAGAFDLAIDSPRRSLRMLARCASWRSRLTRIPYGDQALFLRRSTFWEVGGYPPQPLMEDVALMEALKGRGDRPIFLRDRVRVSARRWEREGILYCTLRNWTLLTLYSLGVSPERLYRWYHPSRHPSQGRSRVSS